MSTLQKPHTVEVNFNTDKVRLKNILVRDQIRFFALIDGIFSNYNIQSCTIMEKGQYIILRSLLKKIERSIDNNRNNFTVTIPESIILWNNFKYDIYLGETIHYTAGLIHQKLS